VFGQYREAGRLIVNGLWWASPLSNISFWPQCCHFVLYRLLNMTAYFGRNFSDAVFPPEGTRVQNLIFFWENFQDPWGTVCHWLPAHRVGPHYLMAFSGLILYSSKEDIKGYIEYLHFRLSGLSIAKNPN
jgi:hypothetical protein